MSIITNAEKFRNNICGKFTGIIGNNVTAINLEKGVFNYSLKEATSKKLIKKWENPAFVQVYLDRLRTIYINLKNDDILAMLKSKELLPQTFASMTHQEMNPNHWKLLIEQKIKRDATKFVTNIKASTDMFTCKKCKSKRCTYYELQTRSADEPATIFVTCLDCGKNWKS
jgi:DNA-directed RNA polymerase subunit M/transcription elongation factor TFIIS